MHFIEKIIKRDGTFVPYDGEKIAVAIRKANYEITEQEFKITEPEIKKIIADIQSLRLSTISVEDIQDFVEEGLVKARKFKLAQVYMIYRFTRALERESEKGNTTDKAILSLIANTNKELAEENSNKNTMIAATQRDYIAGVTSRDLTRRRLLPKFISKAHEAAVIHFHDSDYFVQPIFNCCLINMGDMLDNGTAMNGKLIESPKSFQVACTVMTQIIACVASNQYGGQSVDLCHLGKYLARSREKIRKSVTAQCNGEIPQAIMDRMIHERLKEELKSGVQTIQYQINTLMTTNGQSPFVTLFLNLKANDPYITENAMIIEEVLRQRLEGIKNEKGAYITPAFPKLVYALDEHNCLKGGEYDYITKLAVDCSAKRMYPDYISAKKMREHYEGNVFSPMGCRSFLSPWKDENGDYKFEGRFNQGVVSLNLPQIGIISKQDEDLYFRLLDERLEICFLALMCRHEALKGKKAGCSPVHWQYGAIARLGVNDTIDKYLTGGYSTISLGYIGVYEATKLVTGESHTTAKGEAFAMKLMKRLQSTVKKWKEETDIGFGLYGTPAETLCYRFAKIDKQIYGDIKDVTDKGYYTNSYHVDVRENIDAIDKFNFEAKFQEISTGGCISYIEMPSVLNNPKALEEMVRYIYDNIQYAEFNTKSDFCHQCGFTGEIEIKERKHPTKKDPNNTDVYWACPECNNEDPTKMNVTRRTCGYLGENYWNDGKTREISKRVMHI